MLAKPAARVQAVEQVQFLGAEGWRAMSDHQEPAMSVEQLETSVNKTNSKKNVFRKAVRAVGFLEGFGALLWTQVGPNLADEEVAEFEKRVADIAAYIGLPPREVDAE